MFARKKNPYMAVPLKYDQFGDFRLFVKKQGTNFKIACSGKWIQWLKVKGIQVRQNTPKYIFVNYLFNPASFLKVDIQGTMTRQEGRMRNQPLKLDYCYSSKLPISMQKKHDLVNLCGKGIVPDEFHGY